MGKSAFVTHLLFNLADSNVRVVDFTNEMTEDQMCERLLTHICEIDNIQLRTGQALDEFNAKKEFFRKWVEESNIVLTNRYGRRFDDVYQVCDMIKPDFIIIDYIQMVVGQGEKRQAIEDFLIRIGELAKDNDFGVINISQINRDGASIENNRPYMHQLKWSGVLEEYSDSVILLHWDFEKDEYFIFIEKQRHGVTGKIQVSFDPQFNKFRDYDKKIEPKAIIGAREIFPRKDWNEKD